MVTSGISKRWCGDGRRHGGHSGACLVKQFEGDIASHGQQAVTTEQQPVATTAKTIRPTCTKKATWRGYSIQCG